MKPKYHESYEAVTGLHHLLGASVAAELCDVFRLWQFIF
jgi:hypothetical protein